MQSNNFKIKSRIWITVDDKSFIGEGKIRLLLKIKELGSLKKASEEMKMSYRQAWFIVKKMNESTEKPLVILKRGGKSGGNAEITNYGEKIISHFQNLQNELNTFLKNHSSKINY